LNGSVGKDTLLFSVFKNALDCSVRETTHEDEKLNLFYLHNFFCLVREVLFDLVVAEFENLQLVRESCLRRLSLCEVINNFAIRESLLDILIVEVDDSIAIWEGLALNSIVENDFLFTVLVNSLNLSVMSHILLDDFLVR